MVGFLNIGGVVDAYEAGREVFASIRKVPSQATTAGWWADLSMAAGNPPPNYYANAPLEARTLDPYDGIYHGPDQSPASLHLHKLGLVTPTAAMVGWYMLLDYLLYYPFVDTDSTDAQALDNTTAQLTRYTDGAGVQVMAVALTPSTGGGRFTFTYVNQDGVTKTSPVQVCSITSANIASIVTSQQAVAGMPGGPFLLLASGDTGVRSITSVQFTAPNGGLVALALVRPLVGLAIREINTMAELHTVQTRPMPRVENTAYLGMICNVAGSIAAGTLTGYVNFVWSE